VSDERRFEAKYLLDYFAYLRVRSAFLAYCRTDEFARAAEGGRYLVRSLYFDTWDYQAYVEKVTGVAERVKLRVRTYFPTRESTRFLKVEMKSRCGRLLHKRTATVSLDEYDRFLGTGAWGDGRDPLLAAFAEHVRRRFLNPVAVVEYRREALAARDGSGVRVCFDHDLRYARSDDLFCPDSRYRRDFGRTVVLEIKTLLDDIPWLSRMVRDHDLGAEPNSKYVGAINHTQAAIWY
jgi:SPX domain protein involved in polyphosphate accumulation